MMDLPRLEELTLLNTSVCRALADPKRILILYALNQRPRNVSALAECLELPQSTVSRHLRILRHHSLVTAEREGPSVVYEIADRRLIEVLEIMREVMFDLISRRTQVLHPAKVN